MAALAGALAIAALALFMLPMLLGFGGGGSVAPSASPSRGAPTAVPSATVQPGPTPQTYVIKAGDLMSKLAKKFGVTLEALCAANKDAVPNCDKVAIGQVIVIPAAGAVSSVAPSGSKAP